MPKLLHELVTHVLRTAPETLLRLLPDEVTRQLPASALPRVTASELPDLNLREFRADAILLLGDPERPSAVLITEVQNEFDPRKLYSYPNYWTAARARYECPAMVVIFALDRDVAAAYRQPVDLGFGLGWIQPFVLTAADVPWISDLELARTCPRLAVLSAIAHAHEPGVEHVALAAIIVSRDLDSESQLLYPDAIFAHLGKVAQLALEQLMRTAGDPNPFHSDVARGWWAKGATAGEAKGEAKILLKLLQLKGFTVSPELHARISECSDTTQLETWAGLLLTARTLADVFPDA
jgi:hypothetical protein